MLVADLKIIPVGTGSSMEEPLERVVAALDRKGVRYQVGPLGTTLEAETLDDLLEAVRVAHSALTDEVPRLITQLTIDHRLDKEETAESLREVAR